MRLSTQELQTIKATIAPLDPHAQVYLFGSRINNNKRGGDIDLLIISHVISQKDRRSIKLKLYDKIGEQKIDIVIAQDLSEPFVRVAKDEGVLLW